MSKEAKKVGSGSFSLYVPVLVVLLLVAVFFVGRLSSQVEMMGEKTVETNDVVGEVNEGEEGGSPIAVNGLKAMADDLNLDTEEFYSCLDSGRYGQRVSDDMAYGGEVGVGGTPSFFVNKIMVVGAQPASVFEAVIDFELNDGSWNSPDETVSYLIDGNPNNGEVTVGGGVETGVGAVRGKGDSVKIVEFSDFECPYCASTLPTIEALFEKYGDEISLEYRHFPLDFHPNARKAAEASECAGEQGKFWEMHDMIFEVQG